MQRMGLRRLRVMALMVVLSMCVPAADSVSTGVGKRAESPTPRLIVLLVLDQFRAGYLVRYERLFTGGFRRMIDEGFWYRKALVDHAPTLTIPGFATLATGTHPRKHGFVSHALWNPTTGDRIGDRLVLWDAEVSPVGDPQGPPVTAKHLLTTALPDWLQRADARSRSVALGSDGVGAASLLAGKNAAASGSTYAFWVSARTGAFVTSTFYCERLPGWLQRFNREAMPEFLSHRTWKLTVPTAHQDLARPDAAAYEFDGIHTTFPHVAAEEVEAAPDGSPPDAVTLNEWYFDTPLADEPLFALARESVRALQLGQRGSTDFLGIAINSTDQIGHQFGPRSLEQLDTILRLDRLIGAFFEFLDESVGRGEYVVALSADHGGPNIPEFEIEQGRHGRRITEPEIAGMLERMDAIAANHQGTEADLIERMAEALEQADFIARAMTPAELLGAGPADEILAAYRNSFRPDRVTNYPLWDRRYISSGQLSAHHPAMLGIMVEVVDQGNIWTAPSTHGGARRYDREVPIVFMGKGVPHGTSQAQARTVDVAPTLAALAGIDIPDGVDGRRLDF